MRRLGPCLIAVLFLSICGCLPVEHVRSEAPPLRPNSEEPRYLYGVWVHKVKLGSEKADFTLFHLLGYNCSSSIDMQIRELEQSGLTLCTKSELDEVIKVGSLGERTLPLSWREPNGKIGATTRPTSEQPAVASGPHKYVNTFVLFKNKK